jgi:hypothetical protein
MVREHRQLPKKATAFSINTAINCRIYSTYIYVYIEQGEGKGKLTAELIFSGLKWYYGKKHPKKNFEGLIYVYLFVCLSTNS